MKKGILFTMIAVLSVSLQAQVTQLNANKSLFSGFPLGDDKTILISDIDSTLWVTDGTTAGTFQLSSSLIFNDVGGVLNGKFIFSAYEATTGEELYITDGTISGTDLLADIFPGANRFGAR